jgi:hypothetical protein
LGKRFKSLLSTGILALIAAMSADATELCVKCTGPDASYACIVGNTSNTTIDTIAKLYCITALAKSGSHASCLVDRTAKAPCPGERKELPLASLLDAAGEEEQQPQDAAKGEHVQGPQGTGAPQQAPPAAQVGATTPPHDQPPAPPVSDAPPKTVQEMVEKGAKSAGDGLNQTGKTAGEAAKSASTALEKAGSAVGGAAKNSWKCLSSFFSNC